ncbi:MAG: hypothetical protein RL736_573 [Pseudomonadota bacterium]
MTKETTNIIDFKSKQKTNDDKDDSYVLKAEFMAEINYGKEYRDINIERKDANINIVTDKVLNPIDYMNVYLFLLETLILMGKDKLNFNYETIVKSSIDIVNGCYEKEETNG